MPKLGKVGNVAEKKEQIMNILFNGIIKDNDVFAGDIYPGGEVRSWSDEKVLDYYDKKITDKAVDEYKALVQKKNAQNSGLSADEKKKRHQEARPTKKSFGYNEKKAKLESMGLTKEELQSRIEELDEELELAGLQVDKDFNMFANHEAEDRYLTLMDKKDARLAFRYTEELRGDEQKLNSFKRIMDSYKEKPAKPNAVVNFFSSIRKAIFGTDFASVTRYNDYTANERGMKNLELKIEEKKSWIQETKKWSGSREVLDNYEKKNEVDRLAIAKHVVIKVGKLEKMIGKEISEEKLTKMAESVMQTKEFNKVAAELGVGKNTVTPATFLVKYNQELNGDNKPEIKNENVQPQRAVQKEQESAHRTLG